MDRFIARENIKHFVDRLQTEMDTPTRGTLQKLLIAEEDKFAKLADRLDALDENIFRIENKISRLRAERVETELGRQHLQNLEDLRDTFVSKRHSVAQAFDMQASPGDLGC